MPLISGLNSAILLICVLLLTAGLFLIDSLPAALFQLILFLIIFRIAGIPFNVRQFKNLTLLAAFIILLQTLFGPGDTFILNPVIPHFIPLVGGFGSLKTEGFILGLTISCRLYTLVIIFLIFTKTVSPYSLAAGLNTLGFNYKAAFVVSAAFNMIPFFTEEAAKIMDAQKLRGGQPLKGRWFFPKLRTYSSLTLPLVLGAMRKAQVSSAVMDSRAFGIYKERTWLFKPKLTKVDFLFLFICVIFCAVMLTVNFLLKKA